MHIMKLVLVILIVSVGISLSLFYYGTPRPRVTFGENGFDQWTPAAFSPDGKAILGRGYRSNNVGIVPLNDLLRLYDSFTGKLIREFRFSKEKASQRFSQVAFSIDGKHLFACGQDLPLVMWEANSGKEIRTFTKNNRYVWCFALTSDGKHALTADDNHQLSLWEVATGKLVKSVSIFDLYVPKTTRILLSQNQKHAILVDLGDISLWEFPSLKFVCMGTSNRRDAVKQFDLPYPIALMSFTLGPDGNTLLYAKKRGPIYELDIATAKVKRTIKLEAVNDIHVMTLSPKGDKIMTTGFHGQTVVYSFPEGKILKQMPGYGNVQFSPDGKTALTFTKYGRMMVWDLDE